MKIIQWLAGTDREIFEKCSDSDKNKIIGLGLMVPIPAVAGAFSMAYAVSTIIDTFFISAFAGLIWFFMVLFIDRFLVSTLSKSKFGDKTNFLWAAIVRCVFALIVSIAIAQPITLIWFKESIEKNIKKEAQTAINPNKSGLQDKIESIHENIKSLEEQKKCYEQLIIAEESGNKIELECGFTSGITGYSRRCKEIQNQINIINDQINGEKEKIESTLVLFKNQMLGDSIYNSSNVSFDYLARLRILNKLKNEDNGFHIWWVQLLIIFFFCIIGILPIIVKIATPYGEYDLIRDSDLIEKYKLNVNINE